MSPVISGKRRAGSVGLVEFTSFPRRETRQIMVGDVQVGGGTPITIQSMTITKTADHEATLQQIYGWPQPAATSCVACNEPEAAEGLARIGRVRRCRSSLTSITSTDVPKHSRPASTAFASIRATSASRARQDRRSRGQGPGYSDPYRGERRLTRSSPVRQVRRQGHTGSDGQVGVQEIAYFDGVDFDLIKIS